VIGGRACQALVVVKVDLRGARALSP